MSLLALEHLHDVPDEQGEREADDSQRAGQQRQQNAFRRSEAERGQCVAADDQGEDCLLYTSDAADDAPRV